MYTICVFYFQSIAGVVISLLVASTLVSATQCMKALYFGGLRLEVDLNTNATSIKVGPIKVAHYNPQKNHSLPESVKDKTAQSPAIQKGNSSGKRPHVRNHRNSDELAKIRQSHTDLQKL